MGFGTGNLVYQHTRSTLDIMKHWSNNINSLVSHLGDTIRAIPPFPFLHSALPSIYSSGSTRVDIWPPSGDLIGFVRTKRLVNAKLNINYLASIGIDIQSSWCRLGQLIRNLSIGLLKLPTDQLLTYANTQYTLKTPPNPQQYKYCPFPNFLKTMRVEGSNPRQVETGVTVAPTHSCRLYLDILELILHHHRNSLSTLTQTCLVSHTLLHLSRKFLYRSVSLDYCENPYAYEQQRLLRVALAENDHLCGYVRELRIRMSNDPLLERIFGQAQLEKVKWIHVIGGGRFGVTAIEGNPSTKNSLLDSYSGMALPTRQRTEAALKRVFGLPSLRKVTLENVSPLSELYLSCFDQLRELEILSMESPIAGLDHRAPTHAKGSETSRSYAIRETRRRAGARLESLVLNLDSLRPIAHFLGNSVDLSHLKYAHIYIFDPEDRDTIWEVAHCARETLQYLTIRHFHGPFKPGTIPSCTNAFTKLHTLILGTPSFTSFSEDPFRGLIHLFSPSNSSFPLGSSHETPTHLFTSPPHSPNFPSLRTLKIIIDLWGCESTDTPWRDICSYRGWSEIDDALNRSFPFLPSSSTNVTIIFETQCSTLYKVGSQSTPTVFHRFENQSHGTGQHDSVTPSSGGLSTVEAGESASKEGGKAGLLDLIHGELYALRHNSSFILV